MNNGNDEQENPSSQTEKKKSDDSSLVETLTKLIKQEKEKGKTAWTIGKLLSDLKGQRSAQVKKPDLLANFENDFESYVSETFVFSKAQTERRMEIHRWIKDSNLITEKMLISHLEQVIRLKNEKAIEDLLKDLAKTEKENKNEKNPYNKGIIASVVSKHQQLSQHQKPLQKQSNYNLPLKSDDSSESNKNEKSTEIDFNFLEALNTEISDYESQREQKKNQRSDIWGPDLKTSYFPEIENIYSKEPIDEQGLVGLFCTIFPIIKSQNLTIKCLDYLKFLQLSGTQELKFFKIKGIRTRFPDAIIEFAFFDYKFTKEKRTELFIEFEFESYNYIRHKHYDSEEKCHLIVCWKHDELSRENWKKIYYFKPLPFILSVKNLLETGEINLINLNKS